MPAPSDSPAAAFALAAIANAAAMAVQQDEWSEEANASTFLPPTLSSRGYSSADLHAELAAAQLRLQQLSDACVHLEHQLARARAQRSAAERAVIALTPNTTPRFWPASGSAEGPSAAPAASCAAYEPWTGTASPSSGPARRPRAATKATFATASSEGSESGATAATRPKRARFASAENETASTSSAAAASSASTASSSASLHSDDGEGDGEEESDGFAAAPAAATTTAAPTTWGAVDDEGDAEDEREDEENASFAGEYASTARHSAHARRGADFRDEENDEEAEAAAEEEEDEDEAAAAAAALQTWPVVGAASAGTAYPYSAAHGPEGVAYAYADAASSGWAAARGGRVSAAARAPAPHAAARLLPSYGAAPVHHDAAALPAHQRQEQSRVEYVAGLRRFLDNRPAAKAATAAAAAVAAAAAAAAASAAAAGSSTSYHSYPSSQSPSPSPPSPSSSMGRPLTPSAAPEPYEPSRRVTVAEELDEAEEYDEDGFRAFLLTCPPSAEMYHPRDESEYVSMSSAAGGGSGIGSGGGARAAIVKGKMGEREQRLVATVLDRIRRRQLVIQKGDLARALQDKVNPARPREFYEKFISRRELNTEFAAILAPRRHRRRKPGPWATAQAKFDKGAAAGGQGQGQGQHAARA